MYLACKSSLMAGVAAAGLAAGPAIAGGKYTYTMLNEGSQYSVYVNGINDNDNVTGRLYDGTNYYGFINYPHVEDLGLGFPPGLTQTDGLAINNKGLVVGLGFTQTFKVRDFIYDPVKNAAKPFNVDKLSNSPHAINTAGTIVGDVLVQGREHGFVWKGGVTTLLDVPGSTSTRAFDINDSGTIVGDYSDANGGHGFSYSASGGFSTFDVPGSSATTALSVSPAGVIAGEAGLVGFTKTGASFKTYNYPGSMSSYLIRALPSGQVFGTYYDSLGAPHGFTNIAGTYYNIDGPGATRTSITSVNHNGDFVAQYMINNFQYSLLATCAPAQRPCKP